MKKHTMFARRYAFVLYCSLLLLSAVLLAEFVLLPRLFGMPRAMLLLGFTATPETVIDGQRINALGFTGDAVSENKAPNTVRILLLGSSTMFNRHMAEKLKAALQKTLPDKNIELLDVGIRSHTTQADVAKLQYFAQYDWDFVLFYNGINDLWANHVLPQDFYADYRHIDPWHRRNMLLDNSLLARHLYNTGYTWLRTLNQQFDYAFFPNYQFVFPKKPYLNAAQFASLSVFERNINAIVDTSLRNGAKPILLTFAYHLPANYSRQSFLQQTLDYRNPDHYDSRDVYNWGPPDYVRAGLQQENAVLRNIAAQRNVALIDIDAAMSGHGEWFGDVCHFNNEGVAVFSAQVASVLTALAVEQSAPVLSP
jgi:lysophospholipase L1-like esterase